MDLALRERDRRLLRALSLGHLVVLLAMVALAGSVVPGYLADQERLEKLENDECGFGECWFAGFATDIARVAWAIAAVLGVGACAALGAVQAGASRLRHGRLREEVWTPIRMTALIVSLCNGMGGLAVSVVLLWDGEAALAVLPVVLAGFVALPWIPMGMRAAGAYGPVIHRTGPDPSLPGTWASPQPATPSPRENP